MFIGTGNVAHFALGKEEHGPPAVYARTKPS
jgi:hypothetical protein